MYYYYTFYDSISSTAGLRYICVLYTERRWNRKFRISLGCPFIRNEFRCDGGVGGGGCGGGGSGGGDNDDDEPARGTQAPSPRPPPPAASHRRRRRRRVARLICSPAVAPFRSCSSETVCVQWKNDQWTDENNGQRAAFSAPFMCTVPARAVHNIMNLRRFFLSPQIHADRGSFVVETHDKILKSLNDRNF